MNNLFDLADKLRLLTEKKQQSKEALSELESEIKSTNAELVKAMLEEETSKFERQDKLFYLENKVRASAAKGLSDDLIAALKQNNFDSLVKETVNANTLSSFVKELLCECDDTIEEIEDDEEIEGVLEEQGIVFDEKTQKYMPKWLAGLVNVYEEQKVKMRKS